MDHAIADLTLAIQAGGESRRMGTPKAVVPFLGEPLIMRPIRRLSCLSDDILVTTNDPASFAFLADAMPGRSIRFASDPGDVRGALNGLATALASSERTYVAIVACDMVLPSAALFQREYEIARDGGYDVVVPRIQVGWEPFHAVYSREACLGLVQNAIASGRRRVYGWFDDAKCYPVSAAEIAAIDPSGDIFLNVNTPEDLAAAERGLR